jgi:hypothetical protein
VAVLIGVMAGCGALAVGFFALKNGSLGLLGERPLDLDPRKGQALALTPNKLEASFWTVPVLTEDGATLFGIVRARGKSTNEVVVLDARTGDVRSRVELSSGLAMGTFTREDGWARDNIKVTEIEPQVPMGAPFADGAAFAFGREWILVDAKGHVRASGTMPQSVPEATSRTGMCRMGNDLWVGVGDPRGGGYVLDARGRAEPTRVDPPAGCARPITGAFGQRWSRAQQLRAVTPGRELSSCMTRKKRSSTRVNQCEGYFAEGPSGELIGNLHSRLMLESGVYTLDGPLSRPTKETVYSSVQGLEAGADRTLFVAFEASFDETTVVQPPKGSFEAPKQTKGWIHRGAVAALDVQGKIRWQVVTSASSVIYDSPQLVATPPKSSHATLYAFRPGSLYALDQANGSVRFRIGSN